MEQLKNYSSILISIQDKLFTIGSHLAVQGDPGKFKLPKLYDRDVNFLEDSIDSMEKELPPMRNFILPGGEIAVSHIHIARCICRRAERLAIGLHESEPIENTLLIYLNRLSDFLFILARKISSDRNVEEIPWKPRD